MNKNRVLSNIVWRFAELCGSKGVTFVVSIILARLIDPDNYGVIAIVMVFTNLLSVFVDGGLGASLVQKKDPDDLDFSTVFWFNIIICVIIYVLLFACAPSIERFYQIEKLEMYLRILGITVIISGIKNIQYAYVTKTLQFKLFFYSTSIGTIISAVISIWMAYNDYGIWALIVQNVLNNAIDTLVLWFTVKWKPRFIFSYKRMKKLFSYGWKLLASNLLNTAYNQISDLIIGKLYKPSDLAFYNKGKDYPNKIAANINVSVDSAVFPAMSYEQDNKDRIKYITKMSIILTTYIIVPIMVFLFVCSKTLVETILTNKWLPCVPYLQIFSITYTVLSINTANQSAVKVLGRSDYYLKIEIINKIIGLITVLILMWSGPLALAFGAVFTTLISLAINIYPNCKLIDYGYLEQIKDVFPQLLISVFMGFLIYMVGLFGNGVLMLLIQAIISVITYLLLSKIFNLKPYNYLKEILISKKSRI